MNTPSPNLPALAPATPPQPVSRYELPANALEDALIARMWGGNPPPTRPKPVCKPAPVKQTTDEKKKHTEIRQKMLELSANRWLSVAQFSEELGCDRSAIKSKATSMAGRKFLKAKWFGRVRKYKRAEGPPKSERAAIVEKRRAEIVQVITRPMKMREIREIVGVDRNILGLDLIWLEARGLIVREQEKKGLPATYSPVEKEDGE